MAARRRRRRRGYARRNAGRIVLCTFIEVIVICALVIMVGWNKGMKEWFAQFQQPILKEVDISGIKASFVLTVYEGKIYMSARSIDEVNVQIIAEKLGGGGHINSAGAQFDHTNIEEAVNALKETIDKMIEEGDI